MHEEKSFLSKYSKVEPNSEDWKSIEFKLQLSLGTSAAALKKVYKIENTHLGSSFSTNAKGGIIL